MSLTKWNRMKKQYERRQFITKAANIIAFFPDKLKIAKLTVAAQPIIIIIKCSRINHIHHSNWKTNYNENTQWRRRRLRWPFHVCKNSTHMKWNDSECWIYCSHINQNAILGQFNGVRAYALNGTFGSTLISLVLHICVSISLHTPNVNIDTFEWTNKHKYVSYRHCFRFFWLNWFWTKIESN